MHLLGRSIKIEVNPGTPRAKTVLDIPVWDFDNQGTKPIKPVRLDVGDTVKVTCRHEQWLRDKLPAFEGQPDRYVVWGEGTHRRDVPRHPPGHPSVTRDRRAKRAGALGEVVERARVGEPQHATGVSRPGPIQSVGEAHPGARSMGRLMTEIQPAQGARHTVVVPNSINMVSLLGPGDEHLGLIEKAFDADSTCAATGSRSRASPPRSRWPSGCSTSSSRSSAPARASAPRPSSACSRCCAPRRPSGRPTCSASTS